MSDHPLFWVGNKDPSITDIVTDANGVPIDLTGASGKFRARELGSPTLLVDQPVSNTLDASGVVRYDWTATDIDPNANAGAGGALSKVRQLIVWWPITRNGRTQDVNEALIEVRDHGPQTHVYVELEDFKATKELTGTNFADPDITIALESASRAVDSYTGRRFWLDPVDTVRYYTAGYDEPEIEIDDLANLTELATAPQGDGTFSEVWTVNTDFALEPKNAPLDGFPYKEVRIQPFGTYRRFSYYPDSVRVTGRFGWPSVPVSVQLATKLLAARLLKLNREGAFGVAGLGADGTVVRISRSIPDFELLLERYSRRKLFV